MLRPRRELKRDNTPLGILGGAVSAGGNCSGWWDWQLATDVSGNVDRVPNLTGNGDLAQSTAASRPAASTLLGRRCSSSDGSDDTLVATLTTSLAIGSRHYGWAVGQFTTILAGSASRYGVSCDGSLTVMRYQLAGAIDTAAMSCSDGAETIAGPASDLNPHLWEAGHLTVTTSKFRRDGTGVNGSKTGTSNAADTALYVHGLRGLANGFEVAMKFQTVVLSGPTVPTADQIIAMRDYFRRTNLGLSL